MMKILIFCAILLVLSEPANAQLGDSKINDDFVGDLTQISSVPMFAAAGVAGFSATITHQELKDKKLKLEALRLNASEEQLRSKIELAKAAQADFIQNEIKSLLKQQETLKKQTTVLKEMLDTSNDEVRIAEKNLLAAKKFYEKLHHVKVETLTDAQKNADHKLRVYGEDEKIVKAQHEKVLLLIKKNLNEQETIGKQIEEAKLAAELRWRESSIAISSNSSEKESIKELEKILKLNEEVARISKIRMGYGASGLFLVLSGSGLVFEGALLKTGNYVDSHQFEAKIAKDQVSASVLPITTTSPAR